MAEDVRIVLVDDHPVVRQGLRTYLDGCDGLSVQAEAGTAADAFAVTRATGPDVVLLDLALPDGSGIDVLRRLRELDPTPKVVVLTSFGSDQLVVDAVEAGADGFLHKDASPGEIEQAIRSVHAGEPTMSARATAALVRGVRTRRPAQLDQLTPREREVLEHVAHGRTNREIAATLSITEKTVKTHVSNVLSKLGVDDRTQAALTAVRAGLVDPRETG